MKIPFHVLAALPATMSPAAGGRMDEILGNLDGYEISRVTRAAGFSDAAEQVALDFSIQVICVAIDQATDIEDLRSFLTSVRHLNADVPIFLAATDLRAEDLDADILTKGDDFIYLFEDTAEFMAGRIIAAAERYREKVLPPMFGAMVAFNRQHEYSWHTPGHTGGTGFLKSPAGRAFFEFFGENLLRNDLSISVGALGSLLDHSGPIGAGEAYAATVFGSDRTYYVTNGSSTSNRVILMSSVTRGQIALCDRNCHKSVEHAMTMSGASPVYMVPSRNGMGIIGPIPPSRLTPEYIRKSIAANAMLTDEVERDPVHAIITNSTYDGLCYNVARVEEILGAHVDRLHFDEAWYGYARFNPFYAGRFAMHGAAAEHDDSGPTVFATQSTHKLLAALSQASMIHIRDGRNSIDHDRFNESFMMHASTSPLYPVIASCDVSAAMMDRDGERLTRDSILEAIHFRQRVARLHDDFAAKGSWFFTCWQPIEVSTPDGGRQKFHEAAPDYLADHPEVWHLNPGDDWHGFEGLDDGWCLLDPIKVSVYTPGISPSGVLADSGIPAAILTAYLGERGTVNEKTTDFTVLFLFSIGITKGKWSTLLNGMLDFKADYDRNAPLAKCLPSLVLSHPNRYAAMGLRDLCDEMFAAMTELQTTRFMSEAFATLPEPEFPPVEAYERLVRNEVEYVDLDGLAGRTVATGVVPYPPGIPLLMPGERAGDSDGAVIGYLRSLQEFDKAFPGFEHDTHGVEAHAGQYRLLVLKSG
ncbi:Orn/Lys/Arg decarboxylase N-terminal domain-containing protein [Pseudooceanicola sp. LIPI14-2-Ac024]|uniref:Orn/Lys/Arg family decarboxylase n=1 Tax=Pseudooceanicola sp. LIPI14-2-Ac024 TaxID=3344875 RepID=UPI0035D0A5D3